MKRYWLFSAVCILCVSLLFAGGCQKQSQSAAKPEVQAQQARETPEPAAKPADVNDLQPEITFEKLVHDFGKIQVGTTNTCEFKFTNTGKSVLEITNVHAPCGCTTPELSQKQYQPGQSGTLIVKYRAGARSHVDTKSVYVSSNDKKNPKVTLTIKAETILQVSVEPAKLNLSLRQENAGCPQITIASADNQPFAIKRVESTGESMIVDFNSVVQSAKFTIQPKVDVEKLRQLFGLEGILYIDITHPQCQSVTVSFSAPSEFKIDPPTITVLKAEALKPVLKKVSIINNYDEPFEIASVTSRLGYTKILKQQKDPNGCTLELEITPPLLKENAVRKTFSDSLIVKIKDGESFKIPCRGFYASQPAKPSNTQ